MPRKSQIKIVDVVDKDVESDAYAITNDAVKEGELPAENEPSETAEEIGTIEEKTDEKLETIKESQDEKTDNTEPIEPAKKIREQKLIKCEKCGKFVTAKTLKYTHGIKCGEVKKSRPRKSEIKINENVQEETQPNPAPVQKAEEVKQPPVPWPQQPKTIVKEVVKSYEEMRKDRLKERLKQREERNVNLFKQVL